VTVVDERGFKKRIISAFAWRGATKFLVQTVGWASTIFVARILLPSDYGLVAVSGLFIGFLGSVAGLGLADGLINKQETTQEEEDGVFYLSLVAGFLMFLVVFLLAPFIANFFEMPLLVNVMRVSALVLVFSGLQVVPYAIAMRKMDFRYRSLVEMGGSLIAALTAVALAMSGFGVWSLVLSVVLMRLFIALAYLPQLDRIPRRRLSYRKIKTVVDFGTTLMVSRLMFFFYSHADVFIVGKLLGQKLVGYYSMAFQLAMIPLEKIGATFNEIAFPALSRVGKDRTSSKTLYLELHRYLLIVSYPILLGIVLVAEDAVIVLLTDKWAPTVPLLQLLCIGNLLRISGMLMPAILAGLGKAGLTLRYNIASMIVLPTAFLIGVQFGLVGVACAWLVAYPPLYLLLMFYGFRELQLRLSEFAQSAKSALVGSGLMVAAVMALKAYTVDMWTPGRLLMTVIVGGVVYLGTFVLFYRDQLAQVRRGFAILRSGQKN